MDPDFWHARWSQNQIGFHEPQENPLLLAHIQALALAPQARVFLPLCGKTKDIGWLLSQGIQVAGAELSPLAVDQLFADLGVVPAITQQGELRRYQADGLTVFAGDIFALTPDLLGHIDAVYDRAALVALPAAMRQRYAAHLTALTQSAPQLLICFAYDQSRFSGPPFSVSGQEVTSLYGARYDIRALADQPAKGGLKARAASEQVWHLTPKR